MSTDIRNDAGIRFKPNMVALVCFPSEAPEVWATMGFAAQELTFSRTSVMKRVELPGATHLSSRKAIRVRWKISDRRRSQSISPESDRVPPGLVRIANLRVLAWSLSPFTIRTWHVRYRALCRWIHLGSRRYCAKRFWEVSAVGPIHSSIQHLDLLSNHLVPLRLLTIEPLRTNATNTKGSRIVHCIVGVCRSAA